MLVDPQTITGKDRHRSAHDKEFINLLNDSGLTQLVTKPTRLENTLDLMITNNPTRVNRTEILPGISDHEIVLCELDIRPNDE